MSERKWTKGPLGVKRAQKPVDGEYDWAVSAVLDGRPVVIAEVFGRVAETTRPDAEATAHLIAAAPELFDALTDMLRIIEAMKVSTGLGPKQVERVAKARAALSRAEGG